MNGLEQLYGSLEVNNATKAVTFNAATLQLVSGELAFAGNTVLQSLNLAQLTTVGSLSLNALPALENAGLTSGITSADAIVVSDTGLSTLEGINVVKLKTLDINNNGNIELIDSGLQQVTDSLSISYNSDQVDVKLDQLTSVKDMVLQSIGSISLANLTSTNGSLSFSSSSIEKIEISSLKSIGNSLTINKNSDLTEIEFSKLTSIGGALQISDNDDLSSFSGFPELKTVGGSVNINGSFDNGTFESLDRVSGGFNLRSSGDLSCEEFNELNSDGDIKGDKYYCSGADKETSSSSAKSRSSEETSSSSDDSESDESSSSSKSSDSGASKSVGGILGFILGAAALGVSLY